ncbi:MAG: hypothetical protein GXP63_05695 [DPANN group archaeon]|nr:hypothetical protein [DPANN group archaeon]
MAQYADLLSILKLRNEDLEWYNQELSNLKNEYHDEFIAINEKKIIDTDSRMEGIIRKLKQKKIDPASVIIKFISKIDAIL